MGRRFAAWVVLAVPGVLAVGLAVASCNSSKGAVGLGGGCSLNSDCNSPLYCVLGLCHEQCATQRDCPPGQPCVLVSGGAHVCELPTEGNCAEGGTCSAGQSCGETGKCGTACSEEDASACVGD